MTWTRHPCKAGNYDTHYAHYRNVECPHVWVRWCGHPTALWKYFVIGIEALEGQTFRTVKEAKQAAEELLV
jgi:hypothetical protein